MDFKQARYSASWQEFLRTRDWRAMLELCKFLSEEKSERLSQEFFKHLISSMNEFFDLANRRELSLQEILDSIGPFLRAFNESFRMNVVSIDPGFFERVKELVKVVFAWDLEREDDKDCALRIIASIMQMLDIVSEYKIVMGNDDKVLQFVYGFYQTMIFYVSQSVGVKNVFLCPFLPEEKFLVKIQGVRGETTDLMLILLSSLKKISEQLTVVHDHNLTVFFSSVIKMILEISELKEAVICDISSLASRKILAVLGLQKLLFSRSSKRDQIKTFLSLNLDIFREFICRLWIYALKTYDPNENTSFTKDPSLLGVAFSLTCNLFMDNTYIEDLEVLLLSVVITIFEQKEVYPLPLQLFTYVLQFMKRYFKKLGLRTSRSMLLNSQDSGLVGLLFNKNLFYTFSNQSQVHLKQSLKSRHNWSKIWELLCKNPKNFMWLSSGILSNLSLYFTDFAYIIKIKEWIVNEIHSNEKFIRECIKNSFIEESLKILKKYSQNPEYKDNVLAMLQVISVILNLKDLFINTNTGNISKLLCDNNLLGNPMITDIGLKCVGEVMRINHSEAHVATRNFLDQLTDPDLLLKFCKVVSGVLKSCKNNSELSLPLCKANWFSVLKNKLLIDLARYPSYNHAIIWSEIISIIKILLENNENTQKKVDQFEFDNLARLMRTKNFEESRENMCQLTIDDVYEILFDRKDTDNEMRIRVPEVIPLLLTMLMHGPNCEKLDKARGKFQLLLLDHTSLPYFAKFGCIEISLFFFRTMPNSSIFQFFEKILTYVIPYNIIPQDLDEILKQIREAGDKKKLFLIQSLEQGLANSLIESKTMSLSVRPTKFFFFRNKRFFHCVLSEDKIPKKNEFSVFFWIYLTKMKEKFTIVEISDKNSNKFKVKMTQFNIFIVYTDGKKKKYSARANLELNMGEWYFFGISMKSQKAPKIFKTRDSVMVYCNNQSLNVASEGSLNSSIGLFKSITIGKSFKHSRIFDGRITSFYIANICYTLEQFDMISKFSPLYVYDFADKALCSWFGFSLSTREIFDSIAFSFTPYMNFTPEKIGNIENDCERFLGTSIVESITALGGIKIFMPLINLEKYNETVTVAIIKIMLQLIKCSQICVVIDFELIQLLANIINSLPLTPVSIETSFKIAVALNHSIYQKTFLKLIQVGNNFASISINEKIRFLPVYIKLLKKNFDCNDEGLNMLYNYVKDIKNDSEFFFMNFNKFIHETLDEDCIKGMTLVIYNAVRIGGKEDLVLGLLKVLIDKNYCLNLLSPLEFTLYYSLEMCTNPKIRIEIIAYLLNKTFRSYDPNKNSEQTDSDSICSSISNALFIKHDYEILKEIVKHLSLNKGKMLKGSRSYLLSLVVTKLSQGIANASEVLGSILDYSNKLAKKIYKSPLFPDWLIKCYDNYTDCEQVLSSLSISIAVFQPGFRNYHKFRVFLAEINKKGANTMEIYQMSLGAMKCRFTNPVLFLDFMGILEEILPKTLEAYKKEFKIIVRDLASVGKSLKLTKTSSPAVQQVTLQELKTILKAKPIKRQLESEVYLKEGGFFRMMLKYILIGISIENCSEYMKILEDLIVSDDQVVLESKYLLYSEILPISSQKPVDSDFYYLYLFCELMEILYSYEDQNSLFIDFLLLLIMDLKGGIHSKLMTFINNTTKEDFITFRTIILESKNFLFPSWRCHMLIEERMRLGEILQEYDGYLALNSSYYMDDNAFYRIFQGKMLEKMVKFNQCSNSSDELIKLLKSKEWIADVHVYLLLCTSVRMNLISTMSSHYKLLNQNQEKSIENVYNINNKPWIDIADGYNTWTKSVIEYNGRLNNYIDFRYKKFVKSNYSMDLVLNDQVVRPFKIRSCLDQNMRNVFLKGFRAEKVPQQFFVSPSSPNKLFESYYESLYESLENEFEVLEFSAEAQEDLIDDSKSVSFECERIKIRGSYFGKIEIDKEFLAFYSDGKLKPETSAYIGSALNFTRESHTCNYIWHINEISEVLPRRFIHRATAIEVYMKSGKTYYFNTFSTNHRKDILESMKPWTKHGVIIHTNIGIKEITPYTNRWKKGQISNFDYLMILNKYCNRSFNDISQYPVFPWVITDFISKDINVLDKNIYRELEFPIGSLNQSKREEAKKRYDMMSPMEEMIPFHYGSHYSNCGSISYYLLRLEPFSSEAKKLQGGNFDVADRLFHGIEASWNSCLGGNSDVKELIPEFFYFADFLINVNSYDLGFTQSGKCANSVTLPPWAKGSAINFIRIHRKCLESIFVSKKLNLWIDLVFGCKQQGMHAIEALNVFPPASYTRTFEKMVESEANVQGPIDEAYFFGQTPTMMFGKPHPAKEDKDRKEPDCRAVLDKEVFVVCSNYVKLGASGKIISLIASVKLLLAVKSDNGKYFLIKIKPNRAIEEVPLESFYLIDSKYFAGQPYWKHTFPDTFSLLLDAGSHSFSLFQDRLLISSLHIDSSLRLHLLDGTLYMSLYIHSGLTTSVSSSSKHIFSGGLDCSIISWDLDQEWQRYKGHAFAIRQIVTSESFQIIFSLDYGGILLLHDIRSSECLRKIRTIYTSCPKSIAISEAGVLAVAYTEEKIVHFFTMSGCEDWHFSSVQEYVWCMKFDNTGEILVCGSTEGLSFVEVFTGKWSYGRVENHVLCIEVLGEEEGVALALDNESEPRIYFVNSKNANGDGE